jgi:hypothetical protein
MVRLRPRGIVRAWLTVASVVFVAAGCGGAAATSGLGSPPSIVGAAPSVDDPAAIERFYPETIVDPQAGGQQALAFLVPEGWQYQGSVQWLPQWERVAFLQTRVSDPGSGLTIDWLPIQDFTWFPAPAGFDAPLGGNYQGQVYLPPITDPAQFVAQFWVPGTLPELQSAQLVSVTPMPALANEFKTEFGGPADAAGYRLRYAYQQDGQPWEEDVTFGLLFSGTADRTSWYVNLAYAVRAPQGQLDAKAATVSTVVASRTSTPGWEATYRFVQKLFTKGLQQQMADTQAFGQLLAQNRAEIAALQDQVTQERQASEDRIAELRGETLAGVETYDDPVNGGAVQLPVGFDEYWVNEKGEYLSSAQPGFDPNTLNDGTWQRLAPRP